jgi:Fur family transcriptional regulator, ferric uptake regulator
MIETHSKQSVASAALLNTVESGCARLRQAGLRITRPRVALIESLAAMKHPVPIEELHQTLRGEACDLVTVYRCLAAFEEIGLVRRSFLHNGTSVYELTPSKAAAHHNLVCKGCGKTERVECSPPEGADRALRKHRFADVSLLVQFFGICPSCQVKRIRENAGRFSDSLGAKRAI